jgi:hypothetical protein
MSMRFDAWLPDADLDIYQRVPVVPSPLYSLLSSVLFILVIHDSLRYHLVFILYEMSSSLAVRMQQVLTILAPSIFASKLRLLRDHPSIGRALTVPS